MGLQKKSTVKELNDDGVVRDSDGVPTSIRIFKVGSNPDIRGFDLIYKPSMAGNVTANDNRTDKSVPFDIAHGMTNPDAPPESHEAVGWGDLRCDESGVWLDNIQWDAEMRQKLIARRFRFISPTFLVDQKQLKESDGKRAGLKDLMTVSLTNIPATSDIDPIIQSRTDDVTMIARSHCSRIMNDATSANRSIPTKRKTMSDTSKNEAPIKREDEDDEEEEAMSYDFSAMDPEGMDGPELKKALTAALEKIADLSAAKREDDGDGDEDEDSDEDDDGDMKRAIARELFADRLITTIAQRRELEEKSLRKVVATDRKLRASARAKDGIRRAKASVKRVADLEASTNPSANDVIKRTAAAQGMTPEQIEETLARYGIKPMSRAVSADAETLKRASAMRFGTQRLSYSEDK